jgi:hypothetical protein
VKLNTVACISDLPNPKIASSLYCNFCYLMDQPTSRQQSRNGWNCSLNVGLFLANLVQSAKYDTLYNNNFSCTELLGLSWTLSIVLYVEDKRPIALYNIYHRQNPFKSTQ